MCDDFTVTIVFSYYFANYCMRGTIITPRIVSFFIKKSLKLRQKRFVLKLNKLNPVPSNVLKS